jgi:hypothetical protein
MASGVALASQTSQITPSLFTAIGDASFELETAAVNAFGTAIGLSMFQIVFDLPSGHEFALEGIVEVSDSNGFASIVLDRLSSPAGPPLLTVLSLASTTAGIDEHGVLAPGL